MSLPEVTGDLCTALFNWTGPSHRSNRVFSPGFVALCIIVAILELVVLHGIFGGARTAEASDTAYRGYHGAAGL